MAKKTKPYKTPLTSTLCCDTLKESSDGVWYTNNHWMARRGRCTIVKSTPTLSETKVEVGKLRLPIASLYREAWIDTNTILRGYHPVVAQIQDQIITWISPIYAHAWDHGGCYVATESDPILFGGRTLDEAYAVVMPVRHIISRADAKRLIKWLGRL